MAEMAYLKIFKIFKNIVHFQWIRLTRVWNWYGYQILLNLLVKERPRTRYFVHLADDRSHFQAHLAGPKVGGSWKVWRFLMGPAEFLLNRNEIHYSLAKNQVRYCCGWHFLSDSFAFDVCGRDFLRFLSFFASFLRPTECALFSCLQLTMQNWIVSSRLKTVVQKVFYLQEAFRFYLPISKHFFKRHFWQNRRVMMVTSHSLLKGHLNSWKNEKAFIFVALKEAI